MAKSSSGGDGGGDGACSGSCVVASIACRYPKLTRAIVGTCIVCSSPFALPLLLLSSPALLLLLSLSFLLSSSSPPPLPHFISSKIPATTPPSPSPSPFLCHLYNHARKHLFLCFHGPNKLIAAAAAASRTPSSPPAASSSSPPPLPIPLRREDSLPRSFLYKVVVYHLYGGGDDEEWVPDFSSQLDCAWRHLSEQGFAAFHPPCDDGRDCDDAGDGQGQDGSSSW